MYDEKELEKSWLISYSDLFTLLFVIIVIVAAAHSSRLSAQMENVKKAEAAQQESMKTAIASKEILDLQKLQLQREVAQLEAKRDALVSMGSQPQTAAQEQQTEDTAPLASETVKGQLAEALKTMNVPFTETEEGISIRLAENVTFSSGSAELKEEGAQQIDAIATVLQRFEQPVRIEGHTDDQPIVHSSYPSNWELSGARAFAVMRRLVDHDGLPAARFVVAGLGDSKPLVDNSNEENRALNRRVEIIIVTREP